MKQRIATLSFAVVAMVATNAPTVVAGSTVEPREVVQTVIDNGIEILRRDGATLAEKRDALQAMVEQYFDFETLAKLVVARDWRRFSSAQQEAFVREFKTHLSLTYSKNLESYNNEIAEIIGVQEEARGDWTVRTKVVRPDAEDVLVNYRLRQRQGSWRMIDVVVEGVSLVSNWRAQFREVLGSGAPEKLIDELRRKNAALQREG